MNQISKILLTSVLTLSTGAATGAAENSHWAQWRGPDGSGVAPQAKPPVEWSESKNVKWKVAVPGSGTSTPIVWGNQVFILTAIPVASGATPAESATSAPAPARGGRGAPPQPQQAQQFTVLCLDRESGKILWQRVATEQVPHEGHHQDHGFASASPVTDGEHLYAYFGSRGLYCYDLQGNLKWDVDFGDMQTRNSFGEGSSPALHADTVVVVWDHEGDDDFIAALDKATGQERWRTPRNESTSWTTPVFAEVNGKMQVIVAGSSAIRSYDLATGREIWTGPGLTANVIPTPIVADGVLYAMSGFRGASLQVIKLGATGDLAGTDAILWSHNRNTPYVPSPALVDNYLYFGSGNNAMLSCFNATTGQAHYTAERLEDLNGIYASPVVAGNHVYVLGRNGVCLVLEKGPTLKVLHTNKLDDRSDASIALAGDDLFLRGHQHLYCIREN